MKVAVFFPLLLLVCSVSTDPVKKKTDDNFIEDHAYGPVPNDIHAVLRELTASLAAQKVEIRELQKDNEAQAEKLKELDQQKTEVDQQKQQLQAQAEKLKELDKKKTEVDKLKTEVDNQKTEVDKLKQQLQGRQVAFSVALTDKSPMTLGPFQTHTNLVYKYVVTNTGLAYNSNTGVFTAPVRGAYHFEFYIGAFVKSHRGTAAVLVKNQDHVFATHESQTSGFASASNGVTLILEVGDKVFVRLWEHSVIYDNLNRHSTFSGHLLFAM